MNSVTKLSRTTGVTLVVLSAVVFSSAGIFTKGVATESWGVIFWRGLAAAGFTAVYILLSGSLRREIKAFSRPALAAVVMMTAGTAAFIPAFKLTGVANVALIYAAAPFIAAGLSWLFINEAPTRTVLIASTAAFLGVLLIVADSFGTGPLAGDLLAAFMTLMMAGVMVIYRRWPDTTAALPAAVSSLILLPIAAAFGAPFIAPASDLPWLILFGLAFAVASVTLAEGARRLPSAETALLSILEVPLAPVLAYLILSEVPSAGVLLGGCVILLAVLWSQTRA